MRKATMTLMLLPLVLLSVSMVVMLGAAGWTHEGPAQ